MRPNCHPRVVGWAQALPADCNRRAALAGIARADTGNTNFNEPTSLFRRRYAMQRLPMRRLRASTGGRRRSCTISPTPMRRNGTSSLQVLNYEAHYVLAPRDPTRGQPGYVRATAGPSGLGNQTVARFFTPTTWTLLAVLSLWLSGAGLVATRRWRIAPAGSTQRLSLRWLA